MKQSREEPVAFGNSEVLKLVAQKLASQALLFGLAVVVVLVAAWQLTKSTPLVLAILFVFVVALQGYLFVEQKNKLTQADPRTMSQLNGGKMNAISNPTSEFTVELWTAPAAAPGARDIHVSTRKKQASYRIGDKVIVGFQASRDCYLTLLNIGTSGKLTVLFPNALHRDNFIKAGCEYRIPAAEDDFEYQLGGPPGVEKIKAIATLNRIELLETNFAPDGSLFRTAEPAAGARDIAVVRRKVESVPKNEWSETACEFRVS